MAEQRISITESEKEQFKQLKMLQDLYNLIAQQMKSLDEEIKTHNNNLVRKINKRYNCTMEADYTYDEVNERLLHCLANIKEIESSVIKVAPSKFLLSEVETEFGMMLKRLAGTYNLIEKTRRNEGVKNV